MSNASENLQRLRRVLVEAADFDDALVATDYQFGNRKVVSMAGFAYRPLDARSVCLGVVPQTSRLSELSDYRELGAPLLLREAEHGYELWKVGANADRDDKLTDELSIDGVGRYFQSNAELQPRRIYEAKTYARVSRPSATESLFSRYVDPDLLPFVEETSGDLLTQAVVDSIRTLVGNFGAERWTIEVVFRLLAGKILRDKNVPGFKSVTLSDTEDILRRVEKHYGSQNPLPLNRTKSNALTGVMERIQELGDFRNLTTEALGDVYERALITEDIRQIHGTHKTPSYLVDYIVWHIAKWIDQIPVDDLRFFEPGCGHAPFLVSAMRMLRVADIDVPDLSKFFRERFVGFDNDPFALEIARLSLTLADEPNPNGWGALSNVDMYADGMLEKAAANATVMLTNPPYEQRKAEELLWRTLPNLPVGAIFAAVVPATILFSAKPRAVKLRQWMAANCQISEISMFPDGLFTFADHECAVFIGRRLSRVTSGLRTRIKKVGDNDLARSSFKEDYVFSSVRDVDQSSLGIDEQASLWVPEFTQKIWDYLKAAPRLNHIATANQGLSYLGIGSRPSSLQTVSDTRFENSKRGFASSAGDWMLHDHPPLRHLSLDKRVVNRFRSGADQLPQVLVNYHPVSRDCWRLKPFIDSKGRPFQSNFTCVRPLEPETKLEFIWALLMSPVANLFVYTHLLKRNIKTGTLNSLPIPHSTQIDRDRVADTVDSYFSEVKKGEKSIFNQGGFTESSIRSRLLDVDAAVLRLYGLPAKSERLLLEQFRGVSRPGVPAPFKEYYSASILPVPLHAYLSNAFQRHLKGESPELSDKEVAQFEDLTAKADAGSLTRRETERLYNLQAEVDGRDYASNNIEQIPVASPSTEQDFDERLRKLSERAANLNVEQSRK